MSSFIKDIISRIPGARDEEFGNGNLSPLGLLIFLRFIRWFSSPWACIYGTTPPCL